MTKSLKVQKKVQVWIYFRNEEDHLLYFLLLKTRPERGGFWQPVTGSIEAGEGLKEAALREAQEESGLQFSEKMKPIHEVIEFESRGRQVQETCFSIEVTGNEASSPAVQLDSHEHVDYQWATAEKGLKILGFPSNAQVLKKLLKQLNSIL